MLVCHLEPCSSIKIVSHIYLDLELIFIAPFLVPRVTFLIYVNLEQEWHVVLNSNYQTKYAELKSSSVILELQVYRFG